MKKVGLIILDGWGLGKKDYSNAIYNTETPFMEHLYNRYPHAQLLTHGANVGLPDGQMGNSEVGHLNIGAGRIVYQDLVRINRAIEEGTIFSNKVLVQMLGEASKNGRLHLMGLVSDGGVHSHMNHLFALIKAAAEKGIPNIYVHAFTDGRDCDPYSGKAFIEKTQEVCDKYNASLVSVVGRYYAMDRDKRWERIKLTYDLLVHRKGDTYNSAVEAVQGSYDESVTDEFITPKVIGADTDAVMKEGDTVLCFNFRTDRCREITMALTQNNFPDHDMQTIPLNYYTMTEYDKTFRDVHVIYHKENLEMTLGDYLSQNGLKQIRIAETEKYPHVTFFFNGGREEPFEGERRIMINSPKVATYDLQPEMSAPEVTEAIVKELNNESADFICLNYANPDMVGHTGDFEAIKKAVTTVDKCLEQVVEAGIKHGYSFIVIADHGNADRAMNEDQSPNTAHTLNPVPLVIVDDDIDKVEDGILADVAPTVLKLMGLEQPLQMTGKALV